MKINDYSIQELLQIIKELPPRPKKIKEFKEIEEMLPSIIEFNDQAIIIDEYEEVEGIEIITEEEITHLFGTTFLYPHIYANVHYFCQYDMSMYISDYDQYLIDNGYDPFFAEFIDNLEESFVVPWIELYDSITLEGKSCEEIEVDYFTTGLIFELEKRLDQAKTWKPQSKNPAIAQKYKNWLRILKYIDGFITPQELDVLTECISTYASECTCPYERRKEIRRNLCYLHSWFDIDLLEFESKIYRIDVQILYELTEILLELESLFYCTTNSDSKSNSSSGKHDWPISTFYYCWEVFDFDRIHLYEMEYEITAANYGLIKDIWNSDHVIPYRDSISGNHIEYDYYINQFIDNAQERVDKIDIGDFDCLTEYDLFKDTLLVDGLKLPNHIDYFCKAEITDLCQTKRGDFFTMSQDSLSKPEDDNYSKYLCYVNDSGGFIHCNKESCEGCSNSCTKKILNEQYVLWKKYVQPIELDEYFGANALLMLPSNNVSKSILTKKITLVNP